MGCTFDDLRLFMDKRIEQLGLTGIDCVVWREHEEIFRHAAGFGDLEKKTKIAPGSLINIYSATKAITCVAAMQLVEKGHMLLTDPLYAYLPEYKNMLVKSGTFVITPAKSHVRVVDLFTMTAGLTYELDTAQVAKMIEETDGDFDNRTFAKALAADPLMFEPGEGWNYSFCHDVLGALIEVVSGVGLGEYFRKHIFEPLGMRDAGFELDEDKKQRLVPQYSYDPATGAVTRITDECIGRKGKRHESGGGGLIMSAEDYILFADALACDGVGASGERIIAPASLDLMATNHLSGRPLEDFRKMAPARGFGYGLGVGVNFDPGASFSLAPVGAFTWGGVGGVQNIFDRKNKLSYFVSQHLFASPKHLLGPNMQNIIYSCIT